MMRSCKMKGTSTHIVRCMPVVLLCLLSLLTACQPEEALPVVPADGQQLGMILRVPSNAPTEGYEAGSTYENYIDMSEDGYRIYFFDTDNKFITRFEAADVMSVEGTDYVDYTLLGEVPEALVGYSNFKIVILANWPKYQDEILTAGTTTIENICNAEWAQFDFPNSFVLSENNRMPFYGVHTYENVSFKANEATLLSESITLLRAMAKVEVILETDNFFNLSFDWVRISRYNLKGYCAPAVYSEEDYDHDGNWENDYAETLHLVEGSAIGENCNFLRVSRDADATDSDKIIEKWIAYLPEYENKDTGKDYACVEAKFNIQVGNDVPHKIYFSQYTGGKPDNNNENRLNIERNNLYRFRVKCTGYDYTLTLAVQNWFGTYENIFEYGDGQVVSPVAPWDDEINNDYEF